jgi:hypothetical protein
MQADSTSTSLPKSCCWPWLRAGRVLLLTTPSSAGYIQNPISVYYCYSRSSAGGGATANGGLLQRAIAEVRTRWFSGAPVKLVVEVWVQHGQLRSCVGADAVWCTVPALSGMWCGAATLSVGAGFPCRLRSPAKTH